ncbi:MAG: cupin domain-containing protein [Steroidobacteraceae bacterium]
MATAAPIELIRLDGPCEPESSAPAAEKLLRGHPQQQVRNYYGDASGQFFAGRWTSTRGAWRVQYGEHEFCHILKGRVRIESATGVATTFGPGDSFVVPAGFAGTWEVLEDCEKFYAIFEAKR